MTALTPTPEQVEAWPELERNERLQGALSAAFSRVDYLVRQSWPNSSPSNRAQLVYIVAASLATFHQELTKRE